jgi:argininosuccinate lyase
VDIRLLPHELEASSAWAEALEQAGLLSGHEREMIISGLRWIADQASSSPSFVRGDYEDVHTFVESRLTEHIGPVARKLHTGRSRNDQVATDLRLWVREAVGLLRQGITRLRRALLDLAKREGDEPMPGYTHLQRAQPVLFGHFLLAHFERFGRDGARLCDAAARADACPLGSGALAGCPFPIDREFISQRLGFSRPTANSLDAVSDRDFVVEILGALALMGIHFSQLGEDIVILSSEEFGLLALDDEASTGSSLMPQKKNPDPAELLRAGGATQPGRLVSMLSVLKGLPSGYNRDLQEDKKLLFRAIDSARECLDAAAALVEHVSVSKERMREAVSAPGLYATEVADVLVRRGVPFRDAHEAVGRAVLEAEERGVRLDELTADQWGAERERFFDVSTALACRDVMGGTAPARFRSALEHAEALLEAEAHTMPGAIEGHGGQGRS